LATTAKTGNAQACSATDLDHIFLKGLLPRHGLELLCL